MVRRGLLGESCGKLAVPGDYQMLGRAWQEAGAQEVLEDTGIVVGPATLRIVAAETNPRSTAESALLPERAIEHEGAFVHVEEVSEVFINHELVETALLLRARMVSQFSAPSNPI